MVIDSVHGPEGGVQLSSLYDNLTKSVWSEKDSKESTPSSAEKQKENLDGNITFHNSASNSSSSCSQNSTSSLSYPACTNPQNITNLEENDTPILKQHLFLEENMNLSTQTTWTNLVEYSTPISRPQIHEVSSEKQNKNDSPKVKVIHGEEKVTFRLHSNMGFEGLKQEVAKRFRLEDPDLYDLKYLDDESEWVLLTCDADLHECIDVYKSSSAHAIRILLCLKSPCQAFLSVSLGHLRSS
jgi:PB1 domain